MSFDKASNISVLDKQEHEFICAFGEEEQEDEQNYDRIFDEPQRYHSQSQEQLRYQKISSDEMNYLTPRYHNLSEGRNDRYNT